jgi:hypothetical protein
LRLSAGELAAPIALYAEILHIADEVERPVVRVNDTAAGDTQLYLHKPGSYHFGPGIRVFPEDEPVLRESEVHQVARHKIESLNLDSGRGRPWIDS